jgi:hypothetical protein
MPRAAALAVLASLVLSAGPADAGPGRLAGRARQAIAKRIRGTRAWHADRVAKAQEKLGEAIEHRASIERQIADLQERLPGLALARREAESVHESARTRHRAARSPAEKAKLDLELPGLARADAAAASDFHSAERRLNELTLPRSPAQPSSLEWARSYEASAQDAVTAAEAALARKQGRSPARAADR